MKQISTALFLILLLQSCSPSVKTRLGSGAKYDALEYPADVLVLNLNEPPPYGSEFIGNLKIGDSGFSTDCDYHKVLQVARIAASKAGANIVKLTKVSEPNIWTSNCYRIKARLYRNFDQSMSGLLAEKALKNKSRLPADADYAKIYFYREANFNGSLISYKIRMDDEEVIGRIVNNDRFEYTITSFGPHKFWAKTETEESLIINIERGQEYFVRCGVKMGAAVGRPTLLLIENSEGIKDYQQLD